MNVLAIGAHFDDLELGCGGALAKHCENGDNVIGFIATESGFKNENGKIIREEKTALEEAREASNIIGYHLLVGDIPTFNLEYGEQIHSKLLQIIEKNNIEMIYTHWTQDIHHDHRNLALATLHVARRVNKIVMYRSNWYQSEGVFIENFYVDITNTWKKKEKSIKAYKTEMERVGDSWITYFKQMAGNTGYKVGVKYAEAFQLVKWLG